MEGGRPDSQLYDNFILEDLSAELGFMNTFFGGGWESFKIQILCKQIHEPMRHETVAIASPRAPE